MTQPPQQGPEQLFEQALELAPGDAREAFLVAQAASDPALGRRLRKLLTAHDQLGHFLEQPAVPRPGEYSPGDTVGPFRLLQRLGEGGFGVVWRAQPTDGGAQVALKLLKAGMDSAQVLQRFDAERGALGRLNHPGIAQVMDAGSSPDGRPFISMELVLGQSLVQHADEQRLTLRERLQLFLLICDAVQHAHHKGVVHRDLKPGNVLVCKDAHGAASPKVIDFGVAKAITGRLVDHTLETGRGQLLGTPVYMSPEQAAGHRDVDTRSDIYSLGVMLHELLTGVPPFDEERLLDHGPAEWQRILGQVDPPRASVAWQHLPRSRRQELAAARAANTGEVHARLRGDLDWILARAMEKDRNRRYPTAHALARDLERHLANEPVEAGAPGAWQRLSKFARRNRAVAIGLAVIIPGLTLGASLALLGLQRAEREAARNADMSALLQGLFAPLEHVGELYAPELDTVLSEASQLFGRNHPTTTAILLEGAGRLSRHGDPRSAEPWLRQVMLLAKESSDMATGREARAQLGILLTDLGRDAEAKTELVAALARNEQAGAQPLTQALAAGALARLLSREGQYLQAADWLGQVAALRRVAAPQAHRPIASALEHQAEMLSLGGAGDSADAVWSELFDEYGTLYQAGSLVLAEKHLNYAQWLARWGSYQAALEQVLLALAIQDRHPLRQDRQLLSALGLALGLTEGDANFEERRERWLGQRIEVGSRVWSADSVDLADVLLAQAEFLSSRGRPTEALEPQARAIEILRAVEGRRGEVPRRAESLFEFVRQLALDGGQTTELYSAARAKAEIFLGDVAEKPQAMLALALTSYRLGQYDRARKRLEEAEALIEPNATDLPTLHALLALTYARAGRDSAARRSLQRAEESLESPSGTQDNGARALVREARELLKGD
ncbi:MAG: serine/threonine protein kinase [Planctomycetota bacterium]|jgi:serine/threonine protein kinase